MSEEKRQNLSTEAMDNLHRFIARVLPKYQNEINLRAEERLTKQREKTG